MTGHAEAPTVAPPYRWDNWSQDVVLSVTARTPTEADLVVREIIGRVNLMLRSEGAILQLSNEHEIPQPS